ncbi:MAG: DUF4878 domain-containing protein [Aquificaceae bacterium]
MKKALVTLIVILGVFFVFRSCSDSPSEASKEVIKDFLSSIKDGKGENATNMLYTPYKSALENMVSSPINMVDLSKSTALSCTLSAIGQNIKKYKILDTRQIDKNHTEVTAKLISKDGKESLVNFILIKDQKRWKIANISNMR